MSWINLLRAEWLKQRRLGLGLSLIMPLLLSILLWLAMTGMQSRMPERATWSMLIQMAAANWGVFLATPMALFLTTQTMTADRPKMKVLAIQGRSLRSIFIAKCLILHIFSLISILVLMVCLGILGYGLSLSGELEWTRFGLLALTIPLSLPIISAQMGWAIHKRGFLLLMALPLIGHFVSLLTLRIEWGRFLPWSYNLELYQVRGPEAANHPIYLLCGLILGLILLALGARTYARQTLG